MTSKYENHPTTEWQSWEKMLLRLIQETSHKEVAALVGQIQVRAKNTGQIGSDRDALSKDPEFRTIWETVYPHVALNLLRKFKDLIDKNIMSSDEVALDISQEAIRQAVLKFDPSKQSSFISFCVQTGRWIALNHVPESCPISFVSSENGTEDGVTAIEDHRYKYPLKLKINRFRVRYYQQHGDYPTDAIIANSVGVSTEMVNELIHLGWASLSELEDEEGAFPRIRALESASPEDKIIEDERTRNLSEKFSRLDPATKEKISFAAMFSIFDGRKKDLSPDELDIVEKALEQLSWPAKEKALVIDCMLRGMSRRELARLLMQILGRSPSQNAIRQYKNNLRIQISKILKNRGFIPEKKERVDRVNT